MKIAENLSVLMQTEGITQINLSRHSGVPQGTISRILNGVHQTLELETVRSLARYFHVTIDQLIGDAPLPSEHGAWNQSTGGTREELEKATEDFRERVKKEAAVWKNNSEQYKKRPFSIVIEEYLRHRDVVMHSFYSGRGVDFHRQQMEEVAKELNDILEQK